jgi:DNA-directed RNA polymerase I, II, and III subunit RPABC5
MSIPVRCFTCNKIIGCYEEKYGKLLDSGMSEKDALDTIGMSRYCCRRMFLGHVNIINQLLLFPKNIKNDFEKKSDVDN